MDITVGTAGHIDHGKTALVMALTGVDADRLPEEKQRGITIDIGFAELDLGDVQIGFVDVPGHERFVKNMLAGASGIDLVMLIIAADEGVMPQTREHFEICRLLNVRSGFVVLTKCDLVDDETLEFARLDAAELVEGSFLENAPVFAVSSRSAQGIADLKEALHDAARANTRVRDVHITRLPIDRSFTVKGFGTVVTGTLASGMMSEGDELELMPDGLNVRVRGLQTHGKKAVSSRAGVRVAVNLAGVDHTDVERGKTLTERGVLRSTQILDTEINVLKNAVNGLRSRQRVRVHIGTVEALARISVLNAAGVVGPGERDLIQLRLEVPVVAVPDERLIIRSYSPQTTIAGGRVIDNAAERHRSKNLVTVRGRLMDLASSGADLGRRIRVLVEASGQAGAAPHELHTRTGVRRNFLDNVIADLVDDGSIIEAGGRLFSAAVFGELLASVTASVAHFHDRQPLARGIGLEVVREMTCRYLSADVFRSILLRLAAVGSLVLDGDVARLSSYRTEMSPSEKLAVDVLRDLYTSAGVEVPRLDDALRSAAGAAGLTAGQVRTIFQLFIDTGEIAKVTDEFYFLRSEIERLTVLLKDYAAAVPDRMIDMPKFKDLAGVSRKYAIPLLEYFDREKVTQRAGDKRRIM